MANSEKLNITYRFTLLHRNSRLVGDQKYQIIQETQDKWGVKRYTPRSGEFSALEARKIEILGNAYQADPNQFK